MSAVIDFPERKRVRAALIKDLCVVAGYRGVVCFSCGNAANELAQLIYTVRVCPDGDFQTSKWWRGEEIHKAFPDLLDATSGHLPMWIMTQLAAEYRRYFDGKYILRDGDCYQVPTGSGETIVALAIAFPKCRFKPEYNINTATAYQPLAPMNQLVEALTNK